MKHANQRFGLGYMPKREDYQWATGRRRKKKRARIEGRELE
jgi:hypothetical protein